MAFMSVRANKPEADRDGMPISVYTRTRSIPQLGDLLYRM
jgi:hypothetical protein